MLGITEFGHGHTGLGSPTVLVPEVLAVVLVVALRRHLITTPSPIIAMRLLRGKGFLSMNVINTLYGCAVLGMGALVPLYVHDRFGLSTLASGTVLTARAVGMIAVAGVASFMLRKTGYRLPMAVGFALIAVGSVMLFISSPGLPVFWWLAISAAVTGSSRCDRRPARDVPPVGLDLGGIDHDHDHRSGSRPRARPRLRIRRLRAGARRSDSPHLQGPGASRLVVR
jgi:hypothetical protein